MTAPAIQQPKSEFLKNTITIIAVIVSTAILVVNWYNQREVDRLNHRLDVREAYFNKGLIDGAKDREKHYFMLRANLEQILKHCANAHCNLPLNLRTLPQERQFESLDSILTKNKE